MATGQKNISIGTSDNAKDGISLREAFRRIRKNFAEIYGDTDSDNLTDTETVTETNFDTHITEKIQDVVGGMVTGNTETNITVTYDDSDGTLDFAVAADITDVNAGSGLTGVNEGGGAATLNVGAGDGITVNADDVALASSVAGSGLTYTAGVLSVDAIDTDGIANDAVTAAKMEKFDDALAATDTHILVADGTDFTNVALSGDVTITNAGVASLAADSVDHDELADRYTARASAVTTSGATTLDWSGAAIFPVTMGGNHTLNFSNYKKGQVVSIIVSGAYTITLGTSSGTPTINQVGDGTYDNSTTNLIQVECTDDDSTPEFFYTVGTYSSDTNPA